MIWQIEWAGELVFGYDFGGIAADALEMFTETLQICGDDYETWAEWLPAELGHSCDGCGRYTNTFQTEAEEGTPTDRGEENRLMDYEFCTECRREMNLN